MSTVWTTTGGTTVSQSLADQAATSATNAAASEAAAATSEANAAASAAAGLAKVSSNDTTAAVLSSKIVGDGSTLTVTETNDGSNETLTLSTTGLQAADATLTALAGLTVSADQMIYATGSDAFATTGLTSAARALLDDNDAAAQRTTLGLGTAATSASTAFLASASPSVSSGTLTVTANGITFSDGTTQTTANAGGGSLTVQEEGVALANNASVLNFVGSSVTASGTGATKTITISGGGGGGSSLTIKEEGSALSTAATSLDFVGAGVTASGTGADKTISIPGGIASLSADTNATLGSNLDVATFDIVTGSNNRNVEVAAHGTGYFRIKGNDNPSKIAFLCEQNSHEITLSAPAHSSSSAYALTLPTSLSAGALYTSSAGQLSTGDLPVADGGTGSSNASDARTALGVAIGSDVQAYDAGLASIAGLTTAADKMIYTTGSDTYAVTTITAAGRAILDDADAAAQQASLGLGSIATQASDSVSITGGSVTGITDLAIADGGTGASTAASALSNLGGLPLAGGTMTGQLVVHSTGIQFSDSTTLTTAPTAGVSAGKAIALAMIFGG